MEDAEHLLGRWLHSSEEDHDGLAVYRRPDFPFPPARGRRGVEFRVDGEFITWAIGRGDAPAPRPGRWDRTTDGAVVVRVDTGSAGSGADGFRIVRGEPDLLEVATGSAP